MRRSGKFLSDLLSFGAAETASKATRLLVLITVSRRLEAEEIGYAAGALAIGEIFKALTENGIGQRIIAAEAERLQAVCQTAHRLFWGNCLLLFAVQLSLGAVLHLHGDSVLGLLIAVLAFEYLFMPGGLVQAALAMREGKLKQVAVISGAQVVLANVLSILLAMVWPSPFVLLLPRVLSAPFWLVAMRRLRPWRPSAAGGSEHLLPFLAFGAPIVGIELVQSLRLHADKLLAGALLGPEMLGYYFMAFNAGLSLAGPFCLALGRVLFPFLCQSDDRLLAERNTLALALMLMLPAALAQSLLAPLYVPLLLGPGWEQIVPAVSILCLAAIPLTVWTVTAVSLRADGKTRREFAVTCILTAALLAGILLSAPLGLTAVAASYSAVASIVLFAASLPKLKGHFLMKSERMGDA